MDCRHVLGREPVLGAERHDGVEGRVVHSAAGVELEVILLDAQRLAEAGDRVVRIEAVGQDGPVHV